MYIQFCEHSSKNNILAEEQFGFRTKSTTNNTIFKLTNEFLKALNNKLMVGGIFSDLEKVFDCINHKILLSKLEFYGIKGNDKLWFESYFKNSYQRVLITNNELN
jgi:Reverse transcriptase (RNA-dependent DNA polymerase).